ncbi:hypothetical protein niasHT_024986 [Heterodera trifolii]|uniref:Uncharacterized protein n=1 Tax=Heterodera trifolii TaxID=157864 RepID=A0ABD2KSM4_9BILA
MNHEGHVNRARYMLPAFNRVIVHRKAAQRHRRRTVSKSSGGDSDNGSSSRCHSNANLHAFEESSLEGKEGILLLLQMLTMRR